MNKINQSTQLLFSNFSGDFNPVHVDPIYARRSMYGEQVVHGINTLLLALNYFSKNKKINFQLISLDVKFLKPIFLNTKFNFQIVSNDKKNITINVLTQNSICTKINFEFYKLEKTFFDKNLFKTRPEKYLPEVFSVHKDKNIQNNLKILYNFEDLLEIYPELQKRLNNYQIGVILSLTRLVGMKCPGLNSLFSSFKIKFKKELVPNKLINYSLNNYDNRFSLYDINIFSENFNGNIIAFNRPISVSQVSCSQLKPFVNQNEFKNQRALIIGGSRGLGEMTAKLLSIGGAQVMLSYNKGEKDCLNVTDEINSNGGYSTSIHLNILDNNFKYFDSLESNQLPTHIYYYPTPFIFSGSKGNYSEKLFNNFSKFYVGGFYNLVNYFINKNVLNYFYPSTVALDDFSADMLEYTLAKSSGEKLCEFFKYRFEDINLYSTKLPRLATDQTVSLFPVKNESPEKVILNHLRIFNK
jgi:hypothetical protein